eukprot:TRINITY_DN481_c0_g1_i1.p3 TRINITY_DN481_c0_g1~~TRINITY_DN481_c0_g1_i1.p3  ORF type:complete len:105 (-),score=5.55 TRINITY_DN481_c0_g1_i1:583-897(-)
MFQEGKFFFSICLDFHTGGEFTSDALFGHLCSSSNTHECPSLIFSSHRPPSLGILSFIVLGAVSSPALPETRESGNLLSSFPVVSETKGTGNLLSSFPVCLSGE